MKVRLLKDCNKFANSNFYPKDAELYVTDIFPWADYYVTSFRDKKHDNIEAYDLIEKSICEVIE